MWKEIKNDYDLKEFLGTVNYFHDSCIKELKYFSGAYVDESLSMYPINDKRILDVIVQSQYKNCPAFEMEFIGLNSLELFPVDEKYTCEILDATMILKDDGICWCDCGGLSADNIDNYCGTKIFSLKFRWRAIKNSNGNKSFYFQTT